MVLFVTGKMSLMLSRGRSLADASGLHLTFDCVPDVDRDSNVKFNPLVP